MLEINLKSFSPRSTQVASFLKPRYTLADLREMEAILAPATEITLNPYGRVCASTRTCEGGDSTNYDAVWVRDSVWAYFGLLQSASTFEESETVLRGLLQYFARPEQIERLKRVTDNPSILDSEEGAMAVPHIRFDGRSSAFSDVFSTSLSSMAEKTIVMFR